MLYVQRFVIIALIYSFLLPATAFPEGEWVDVPQSQPRVVQTVPQNVVYNNGPVGGGGGGNESICLGQLVATEKDMDKARLERQIAVTEMARVKGESHVGTTILWTVLGIAAGAGATYGLTRHK